MTITDRKVAKDLNTDGVIDNYIADVVSGGDYYPFGMQMPSRNYSLDRYRYSFNGQEKSTELGANITTALYWEYDARIDRRWNIDPVPKSTVSPYVCLGGNPILYVDPLGNDWYKNKQSRNIEWFDGGESRKGFKKIRGDQNFRRKVMDQNGESHTVDFKSDGTMDIWIEAVVLGSKPRKSKRPSRMDLGYPHLNTPKVDLDNYYGKQTEYLRGRENGMPADPSLNVLGVNFERWYQGYRQGRQLTYGAIAMLMAPVAAYGAAETGAANYLWQGAKWALRPRMGINTTGAIADFSVQTLQNKGRFWENNYLSTAGNLFFNNPLYSGFITTVTDPTQSGNGNFIWNWGVNTLGNGLGNIPGLMFGKYGVQTSFRTAGAIEFRANVVTNVMSMGMARSTAENGN